jgi:hypothetical protein
MTSRATHRGCWIQQFERERHFYETFGTEFPIWQNWARNSCPNLEADRCLVHALSLLYAAAPGTLVEQFLGYSTELIDRGLDENKFTPEGSRGSFPRNRGEGLRARAYARALRGEPLKTVDLRQAIEDFQTWFKIITPGLWDDHGEFKVLCSARLALILGDLDLFEQLLPFRYKIKFHREEGELLLQLKNLLRKGVQPLPRDYCERFTTYFECIRDPQLKPDIYMETDLLRFELGVLYCQYIAVDEPFSWPRVIAEISR